MAKAKAVRTNPSTNKQVLTMPEAGSVPLARKTPSATPSVDVTAQIRARAYELFQERGSTPGNENEDWLRAEREILDRHNQQHTA